MTKDNQQPEVLRFGALDTIVNGFILSVMDEVSNGTITEELALKILGNAENYVNALLSGKAVEIANGKGTIVDNPEEVIGDRAVSSDNLII